MVERGGKRRAEKELDRRQVETERDGGHFGGWTFWGFPGRALGAVWRRGDRSRLNEALFHPGVVSFFLFVLGVGVAHKDTQWSNKGAVGGTFDQQ